ncbi:hypothetical protein [Dyadobacter sp. 3J3]|uniref:hypothetical protein n=1 Tax=Dyadobacter sp. 3J3 TaxID=2606600 RepID=UPI0013594BA3|nr:hypothetical protein [Dyadobacter sp. 3J3]
MKKIAILQLLFLLFTTALSCTDHLPPENPSGHLRVKSITQTHPNDNGVANVTEFYYAAGNQLSYLKSYQTPDSNLAVRARTIYNFDDNLLSSVVRNFSDMKSEKYQFTYNQNRQFNKLDYTSTSDDFYNMTFDYNGNVLKESKRKFSFSSISFEKDIQYNFNGSNLQTASSTTTFTKNVSSVTNSTSSYTYDDKINPFYGNFIIPAPNGPTRPSQGNSTYYTFFGGVDNVLSLSENNILSETTTENYTTTYEYTYNTDGLPLTRVTKQNNGPENSNAVTETLLFDYETY